MTEARGKAEKKQYYAIDFVKFVMCLFIIALHSKVATELNLDLQFWIEKGIFRLGVPFFFITSGFLIGNRIGPNCSYEEILFRHIKRLLSMMIVFEPISIVLSILTNYLNGMSIKGIALYTLRDIIFYPPGALWYIQASIIGLLIIRQLFRKQVSNCAITILAILAYGVALLCNSYYFVVYNTHIGDIIYRITEIISSIRNGVFIGFPLIYLGIRIGHKNARTGYNMANNRIWLMLIVTLYCIYLLELHLVKGREMIDDESLFIVLPIFISFFIIYLSKYFSDANKKGFVLLRNLSTGMYLLHKPIISIVDIISTYILQYKVNRLYVCAFTISLALLCCLITYSNPNTRIGNMLK